MPRVRFISNPKLPRDWADKPYREGYEEVMSDDEAGRWVRRGVAIIVTPAMAAAETRAANAAAAEKEEEAPQAEVVPIPDDWRDHHHATRMALARRLTDEEVETSADADRIIAEAVERREAAEDERESVPHHSV